MVSTETAVLLHKDLFVTSWLHLKQFLKQPSPYWPYKCPETCWPQLCRPFHTKKSDKQCSHSVHKPQVVKLLRVLGKHLLETEGGEFRLQSSGGLTFRAVCWSYVQQVFVCFRHMLRSLTPAAHKIIVSYVNLNLKRFNILSDFKYKTLWDLYNQEKSRTNIKVP